MSTLIFQIDIGSGTQWLKESSINPIRNIFIPSVKKYAEKNQYDYKIFTESEYIKSGGDFNFLATREKHFAFERYYHFIQEYENIIYLDNDIYVFENAKPLPDIKGVMAAPEPEGNSSKIFRQTHNQPLKKNYYNAGVIFANKSLAKHLQDYMQYRLKNKIRALGKNSDNMMLNEYILEHPDNFNILENSWNYMPFLDNSKKILEPNFFHFVGIPGKRLLFNIQKKKKNIGAELEEFIKKNI